MSQHKIIASAVAENTGEIYKTELKINQHLLISDEPQEAGVKMKDLPREIICVCLWLPARSLH